MFHIFTSAYFYDGSSSSLVVENYCKKYDAPLTYFKNTAPCKLIYLQLTMQFLVGCDHLWPKSEICIFNDKYMIQL